MIDLFYTVLLPLLLAGFSLFIPLKYSKNIIIAGQILLFIYVNFILYTVHQFGTIITKIGNFDYNMGISMRGDVYSVILVFTTVLLFTACFLYSSSEKFLDSKFLFLFLALESLIIGIFFSDDLFNIFVLIEVATVIISILIMYKKDKRAIYDGILYFGINIVSMTFFLFGIGIIYKTFGVVDLSSLKTLLSSAKTPSSILLPYAFLLTSVSLKTALLPLFSWLPKAHGTPSAPYVVSAILSGIYVKNGVYLFYRIQDAFSNVVDTRSLFLLLGFLTAVIGFSLAIGQKDLKLILAYHTVSQIGLIMVGLNMPNIQSVYGGFYHIVNHALFKSTLFLSAGMIIDAYGTRNVYKIRGVFQKMPICAFATIFAILGITGAPLFNGSISKYLITEGAAGHWAEYGLLLINLGTLISFIKYSQIFLPDKNARVKTSTKQNFVILSLGILCLIGGLFSQQIIQFLFGIEVPVSGALSSAKLLAFLITLAVGFLIYWGVLSRNNPFNRLSAIELSFNGVCCTIAGYFFFLLLYLKSFPPLLT